VFLLENIFSSVEPIISFRRYMFVAPSSLCVGTREGFGVGRGEGGGGEGRGEEGIQGMTEGLRR
jgi:hypothetical protein